MKPRQGTGAAFKRQGHDSRWPTSAPGGTVGQSPVQHIQMMSRLQSHRRALFTLFVLACAACKAGGAGSVDAKRVFPDSLNAALAEAVADGDKARIQTLIKAGADPNARGDQGVTMLQWGLLNKSKVGLETLLEAGADPALADSSGATVVHLAALANDPSYLDILLARKADPNTPNGVTGATPP